jgi:hypothetical protein
MTKYRTAFLISAVALFLALGMRLIWAQHSAPQMPLLAGFDFEDGKTAGWQPHPPDHWQVVRHEGSMVYELIAPGEQGQVRAPTSWSLISGQDVTSFVFTGRLKCKAEPSNPYRDMCVFFHFQDPTHFYYVHFAARSDEVHNIIGLVNGADRVKINLEPAGKSVYRLTDTNWHAFKITYDEASGRIQAYLDDMQAPILTAVDKAIGHGLAGVGSFDDSGYFDDVKLWGKK